jgi:iron(III) transport system substrate-binding protein
MKKLGVFFICGLVSVFLLAGIAAAKETVVIYTSLENEEIVEYLKVAKKELADLDIQAIRLSTGELGARMLAEKDNPQADCIWGWAVTNMSEFVPKGMLVPYKPKGWDMIPANFKDPNGNWTAIDLYAAALVPNTKVLEQKNMPMPKGWSCRTRQVPARVFYRLPASWSCWTRIIKPSLSNRTKPGIFLKNWTRIWASTSKAAPSRLN